MMTGLTQDNHSIEDIKKVQSLCRDNDDEIRWLIALISDTGMRLSEAAGL